MFHTLKYRPEYPERGFESLESVRALVTQLVHWYNDEHQHSGINFVTPNQCHTEVYVDVLNRRKEVYEQAKLKHLERWTTSTKDWEPHQSVALNPVKEEEKKSTRDEA